MKSDPARSSFISSQTNTFVRCTLPCGPQGSHNLYKHKTIATSTLKTLFSYPYLRFLFLLPPFLRLSSIVRSGSLHLPTHPNTQTSTKQARELTTSTMFSHKGNSASFGAWPSFLNFGSFHNGKTKVVSPASNQGPAEPPKGVAQDEQLRNEAKAITGLPSAAEDALPASSPPIDIPIRRPSFNTQTQAESSCAILSSSEESSEDSSDDSSDELSDEDDVFVTKSSAMHGGRRSSSVCTGYSTPYEEEDTFSDDESLAKVRARRSSRTYTGYTTPYEEEYAFSDDESRARARSRRRSPARRRHVFAPMSQQHCWSDSGATSRFLERRRSLVERQQQQEAAAAAKAAERARLRAQREKEEQDALWKTKVRNLHDETIAYSQDAEGMLRDPRETRHEWDRQANLRLPKTNTCTWTKAKMAQPSKPKPTTERVVPKLVVTDPEGEDWFLWDTRPFSYETWEDWNKGTGECQCQEERDERSVWIRMVNGWERTAE